MSQEAPIDRAAHSQLQAETFNGKADILSKPLPKEVEEVQNSHLNTLQVDALCSALYATLLLI